MCDTHDFKSAASRMRFKIRASRLRSNITTHLQYTCAYYNNFLCLPFFLLTFFIWGEHNTILANAERVSTWGWAMVVFTCVCGYCLATSGFGLQKLVSATTFLVVNNMVKIANILLGMVFLNDRSAAKLVGVRLFLHTAIPNKLRS